MCSTLVFHLRIFSIGIHKKRFWSANYICLVYQLKFCSWACSKLQAVSVILFFKSADSNLVIIMELKRKKSTVEHVLLEPVSVSGPTRSTLAWNGVRYNKLLIVTGIMSPSNFFLAKKIFNVCLFDS